MVCPQTILKRHPEQSERSTPSGFRLFGTVDQTPPGRRGCAIFWLAWLAVASNTLFRHYQTIGFNMGISRRAFLSSISSIPGIAMISSLFARSEIDYFNLDDDSHGPVGFPCTKHCGSFERFATDNDNLVENFSPMFNELVKALVAGHLCDIGEDRSGGYRWNFKNRVTDVANARAALSAACRSQRRQSPGFQCTACLKQFVLCEIAPKQLGWRVEPPSWYTPLWRKSGSGTS